MTRYLSIPALSLAAALTLSACGSDAGSDTSGMGATAPASSAPASPSAEAPGSTDAVSEEHNDADVMFTQMMIPHHQQAVEMSEMMLSKDGISPEVTDLATRIRDAQGPEIETMTGWLEAWGEPMGAEDGHDMGSMGSDSESMGGMMSEDQMSELDAAEGDEASRMFLESMTAHHDGAIDMAQDQVDNGQNREAIKLAESIVETQQAEIDEMEELLAAL